MRPRNLAARERLNAILYQGAAAAADLASRLGVSVPTILRILADRGDEIVRIGRTNKARYALRRPLRGVAKAVPLFRVDKQGRGHAHGVLDLIQPYGAVLDLGALGWPVDDAHRLGRWDGLPYPIYDMRPQGFLGRQLARRLGAEFGLADDPTSWSDDDIVDVLMRLGVDTVGNLILGERAYERWANSVTQPTAPISTSQVSRRYAELAADAMALGIPGSSAAGEFPKFTAARALPSARTPHVIVKFSGADRSATVQRWSDLLVCEHLALTTLANETSLPAATSRVLQAHGRTFLETERFDRHGQFGRSALVSLASLNECFLGSSEQSWPRLVQRLATVIPGIPQVEAVATLWWFGRLIANSDMHTGNMSFTLEPQFGAAPSLEMAPAYDMLPMHYAPLAGGEVPTREFAPPLPLPTEKTQWRAACVAATSFWHSAATDQRISVAFRKICKVNAGALALLLDRV